MTTDTPQIADVVSEPIKSRCHENMTEASYRNQVGLNPSSLAAGLVGLREIDPKAVKDAYEGTEYKPTQAQQDRMDIGTLGHLALLQPERLMTDVAVWTGARRDGAAWDEFCDMNSDKLIIRAKDYADTMRKVNELRSHKLIAPLLADMKYEVGLFTTETIDGTSVVCKGRLDAVSFRNKIIVDPKFTQTAIDERTCRSNTRQFRYREKMALYRRWAARIDGSHPEDWRVYLLYFGIGSQFGVRRLKLTTDSLEFGETRMQQCLKVVAKCLRDDEWPVFAADDAMNLEMWEMQDEEVEIEY